MLMPGSATLIKYGVIALAIGLLVGYVSLLRHEHRADTERIAALMAEKNALLDANQKCATDVAAQNAAVTQFQNEAITAAQAAAALKESAKNEIALEQAAEDKLNASLVRAKIPTDCEGAIRWANQQGPLL